MSTTPHEEKAFLKSIAEAPQEQKAFRKLMFADFLEERGDPRTDLLRKEVAAAESLGWENVHGILSAQRFFGPPNPKTLEALSKAPFPSKEVLDQCKDHMLVLYPGWSFEQLCEMFDDCNAARLDNGETLFPYVNNNGLMDVEEEPYARVPGKPGYLLLPREPFPEMRGHDFLDQRLMLYARHPEYRVMTAAELAVAVALRVYDTKNTSMFADAWMRCSDRLALAGLEPDPRRICVSVNTDDSLLAVSAYPDEDNGDDLSLACCRNF